MVDAGLRYVGAVTCKFCPAEANLYLNRLCANRTFSERRKLLDRWVKSFWQFAFRVDSTRIIQYLTFPPKVPQLTHFTQRESGSRKPFYRRGPTHRMQFRSTCDLNWRSECSKLSPILKRLLRWAEWNLFTETAFQRGTAHYRVPHQFSRNRRGISYN